ncbi:MAG TPA: LamG-like jellyroll fold domain-containing protein, partial [Candidatus Acidoferrum sp.]|nr:LamG-like jellyroll fold domain-containing protein [Candidatus Acidoferrum sp.]
MKLYNSTTLSVYGRHLTVIGLLLMTLTTVRADYHSTVLADKPLAFYPINSTVDPVGTTATDLTGNANNGVYNGTDPEFNTVPGPSSFIPDALSFDGFTSFVDLSTGANAGILNFGGTLTMEAWVQPATPTVGSGPPADIFAKGYDGTNEMSFRANGGNYSGGTYNNNAGGRGAGGGIETTNWTYLACTFDGTNWNFYVNSALVQSSLDSAGAINFTAPWAIGDGTTGTAGGNSGNVRYFQGNITEVALYTNALTAAQVLNHFCVGLLGTSSSNSIPIISAQPQPQSAFVGGTVTFSVGAVSALPTTNQWYANALAIFGQTNSSLTLTNVGSATTSTNYSVVVGNANGKTNSAAASVTLLATGNPLKWNSAGGNGVWDTGISANWLNLNTSAQTIFNTNDQVLFDDTVGVSNNVTVNGTVSPSLLTVNSSTNNFSFSSGSGSHVISGIGTLVKQGSSVLSIFTPQSFSGVVKIGGGTVYAGNNCFNLVSSISITNNSTLDFGGGSLTGNKPITVSGTGVTNEGALFNSYPYATPGNVMNVGLAGDTTFGGTARWDYNGGSINGPHKVIVNWTLTNAV